MTCQHPAVLTDKQPLRAGRFWLAAVIIHVCLDHLNHCWRQVDQAEAIAFAQNGESFLFWVEAIEIQLCDITCTGTGFGQQMLLAVSDLSTNSCEQLIGLLRCKDKRNKNAFG